MDYIAQQAANEAKSAARKAQHAAEEALESGRGVKFIALKAYGMDKVKLGFLKSKHVLSKEFDEVSLKSTDISHLETYEDDDGTSYTAVMLEERCKLDVSYIRLRMTLAEATRYINEQTK